MAFIRKRLGPEPYQLSNPIAQQLSEAGFSTKIGLKGDRRDID
jgi:hypothetical protein